MREPQVRSLGQEDPLEKEMATHSSIIAWRIPWMEETGRLQSTGHKESDTTEQLHFTSLVYLRNMYWVSTTCQALFQAHYEIEETKTCAVSGSGLGVFYTYLVKSYIVKINLPSVMMHFSLMGENV